MTDDGSDAGFAAPPAFLPGRSGDDGGPRARHRGDYAGFLPAHVEAELAASAASGSGLAILPAAPTVRPQRDGLLLALSLLSLYLALSR